MTESTETATHTPVGWHVRPNNPFAVDDSTGQVAIVAHNHGPDVAANRARLIAAACTSYRENCGPNAVECAEDDLLGAALEALRRIGNARMWELSNGHIIWRGQTVDGNEIEFETPLKIASAILDKAKSKETK